MKVNVVSKKLIKPCTPTPQNLNKYKISFTDELMPPMNVGFILFYPSSNPKQVSNLEESLAKILAQFYPLAGRYIKSDLLVDCSDEGAEFVEAEAVDVELMDLIAPKMETHHQLNDLLPSHYYNADESNTDPLLSIQITEFKSCGGLAMGFSVSHRIFDASSLGTFISAWSNANSNPEGEITITPSFDFPSLFPSTNKVYFPHLELSRSEDPSSSIILKRFIFNKEAIMRLRSKFRPNHGKAVISKVRVVSALIAKALIGVDRAKHGKSRACIIEQLVDMRLRTIPPLPNHSCGNLAIDSVTRCVAANETTDTGIQELVYLIGDAIDNTIADCARILSSPAEDARNIILNPVSNLIQGSQSGEVNVLLFTDCTKFGFYEADFGWAKPVWTCIGSIAHENAIVLMRDREGDGIEAWVHLNHTDMSVFQQDQDIKIFTTSY